MRFQENFPIPPGRDRTFTPEAALMLSLVLEDKSVKPSLAARPVLSPQTKSKPGLISFDSSHEFSLAHHLELWLLVETEDHELKGYAFDDESLEVF